MGVGVTKSPQPFHLKNGAPSHADFRRKYVIYRGATTSLVKAGVETQEDVAYLNVEEYLKKL